MQLLGAILCTYIISYDFPYYLVRNYHYSYFTDKRILVSLESY